MSLTGDDNGSHPFPDLSLVEGGPLFRVERALRLHGSLRPAVALAMVAWLPLLVLSAAAGTVSGGVDVPFLKSFGTHTRFLVAVPLLFTAEWWIDPQFKKLVRHIVSSRLVQPADLGALGTLVRSTLRLRDSIIPEAILAMIVIVIAVLGGGFDPTAGLSSWRVTGAGDAGLTPAGWWARFVSVPIFQFLIGRWLLRIFVWWRFLWRFSRLDLQLEPTHPDRAGGLGYLGVVHGHFIVLCFAVSTVAAGSFAEQVLFRGRSLESLMPFIVTLALGNQALFVGPMFIFTRRLMELKRRGLREYGMFGARYARSFQAKWMRTGAEPDESPLGSADIQSLADLAGGLEIIQGMIGMPFRRSLPVSLLIATVVPMLVLLPLAFPEEDLLLDALRLIVGV